MDLGINLTSSPKVKKKEVWRFGLRLHWILDVFGKSWHIWSIEPLCRNLLNLTVSLTFDIVVRKSVITGEHTVWICVCLKCAGIYLFGACICVCCMHTCVWLERADYTRSWICDCYRYDSMNFWDFMVKQYPQDFKAIPGKMLRKRNISWGNRQAIEKPVVQPSNSFCICWIQPSLLLLFWVAQNLYPLSRESSSHLEQKSLFPT